MQIPARNQAKQQSTLQEIVKFFYFLLSFYKHTEPLLMRLRKNMMGKKRNGENLQREQISRRKTMHKQFRP